METIFVSKTSDTFYLARWLFLKKKITQAEMIEYSKKSYDELVTIINDFGIKVKIRNENKVRYEPSGTSLFD